MDVSNIENLLGSIDEEQAAKGFLDAFANGQSIDGFVENEEPEESNDIGTEDYESTEDTPKYNVVSDKEFKRYKKENRANSRIRELANKNNALERELAELKRGMSQQAPATTQAQAAQQIPENFNKEEIMRKMFNPQNPEGVFEAVNAIATAQAKKIAAEMVGIVNPKIQTIEQQNRARNDGINPKDLDAVYEKFPSLRTAPDGYEIAKSLVEKRTPRAKSLTSDTSSAERFIKKGGTISQKEFQKMLDNALLAELRGGN